MKNNIVTDENNIVEYCMTDEKKNKIVDKVLQYVKQTNCINGYDFYGNEGPDCISDLLGELFEIFEFKNK